MNLFHTHPNFHMYHVFIGERKYPQSVVIEADEEKGYVKWSDDKSDSRKTKTDYGRVHIVRYEGYE